MVLQDSVEASSDMRDAGDVCLDEVWEDGMLSVSAWLGPCSQSISTSCSSANRFAATRGGGVRGGTPPPPTVHGRSTTPLLTPPAHPLGAALGLQFACTRTTDTRHGFVLPESASVASCSVSSSSMSTCDAGDPSAPPAGDTPSDAGVRDRSLPGSGRGAASTSSAHWSGRKLGLCHHGCEPARGLLEDDRRGVGEAHGVVCTRELERERSTTSEAECRALLMD